MSKPPDREGRVIKTVRTAELAWGDRGEILATAGIGSCVVVCLWNQAGQIGALAHMMLPHSTDYGDAGEGSRIHSKALGIAPDLAIPYLVDLMKRITPQGTLSARLVGGGNMFQFTTGGGILEDTPKKIIENTRSALRDYAIPVVADCLGGPFGRRVDFDLTTGIVFIEDSSGALARI